MQKTSNANRIVWDHKQIQDREEMVQAEAQDMGDVQDRLGHKQMQDREAEQDRLGHKQIQDRLLRSGGNEGPGEGVFEKDRGSGEQGEEDLEKDVEDAEQDPGDIRKMKKMVDT